MYARPARMIVGFFVAGLLVMYLTSGTSSAQETTDAAATVAQTAEAAAEEVSYITQEVGDELWYLLAGAMVMIMQAGFAMLETGLTRAKNAVNVCTKNLLDFSIGAILYWAVGYSLMYAYPAEGYNFIGNLSQAFKPDVMTLDDGYAASDWFFQMVFCATAATIVSGAMAERTKLVGYIAATVIITAFIYPISAGWGWAGTGWASAWGVRDFAGSNIVHACGAWCALAGAIMVGPRLGKFNADGSANAIPGHNITLATLGTFILWFGWYGFNCGSMLAQDTGMAFVAVTTTLSAGAGALAALLTSWGVWGKPDTTMGLNGALAGLVGITAPCGSVAPWAAVLIGLIAGVIVFFSVIFIEKILKVDDPVGAISVHGVCGVWGTLSVGLFGSSVIDSGITDGLFLGGGLGQLGKQATFVGATFVFAFVCSLIVFAIVKYTIGLRVSDAEQIEGLDLGEHDLAAYPDFQSTNIKSYHLREA
jgi:Amt family ammonium transporter